LDKKQPQFRFFVVGRRILNFILDKKRIISYTTDSCFCTIGEAALIGTKYITATFETDRIMKTVFACSILVLLATAGSAAVVGEPNSNCGCAGTAGVLSSGLSAGKLIHCDDIMKDFRAGGK
jgi:hypothetical protein